jgi:alpha-aminoadipate/glutamate carrier protein LysW
LYKEVVGDEGAHNSRRPPMVPCPQCDANVDVDEDELDEGDTISCDECGATLNVLSTDPIELAADGDEDFEDDDEDFDDDDEESDEEEEEEEEEDW